MIRSIAVTAMVLVGLMLQSANADGCESGDSFCFIDNVYYTNQHKVAIQPSADGTAIEFQEPLVVRSGEELVLDGTMHTGSSDAIFRDKVEIRGGGRLAAYQVNVRFEDDVVLREDAQLVMTAGLTARYKKCHPELHSGSRFIAQGDIGRSVFGNPLKVILPHSSRDQKQNCPADDKQRFSTAYVASYAELNDRSYERIDGSQGVVCDTDPSLQSRSVIAFGQVSCPEVPSPPQPEPSPNPQTTPSPGSTSLPNTTAVYEQCEDLLGVSHKKDDDGDERSSACSHTSAVMPWVIAVTLLALLMPFVAFVTHRYVKHGKKPDEAIRELQDILYADHRAERDAEYAELEELSDGDGFSDENGQNANEVGHVDLDADSDEVSPFKDNK